MKLGRGKQVFLPVLLSGGRNCTLGGLGYFYFYLRKGYPSAQGGLLLLTLYSGITPSSARGTVWDAEDQTRGSHKLGKQRALPTRS